VRVITNKEAKDLLDFLRARNYGITSMDATGSMGPVTILFMVIRREDLAEVVGIIRQFQPDAFYSIEDVKTVTDGVFPEKRSKYFMSNTDIMKFFRKDK
jgi:uncharacterized protein YebE (UPF0316 family)